MTEQTEGNQGAEAKTPPLPKKTYSIEPLPPATLEKEPFYKSVRFWVSVFTPVTAALVGHFSQALPWIESLDQDQLNTWLAGLVLSGIAFIVARTLRNTPISGYTAALFNPSGRAALPEVSQSGGRLIGTRIVKPEVAAADSVQDPKEPFYKSVRFWVSALTPVTAALLARLMAAGVDEAGQLDPGAVTAVIVATFATGIGYVLARTFRNTNAPIKIRW